MTGAPWPPTEEELATLPRAVVGYCAECDVSFYSAADHAAHAANDCAPDNYDRWGGPSEEGDL